MTDRLAGLLNRTPAAVRKTAALTLLGLTVAGLWVGLLSPPVTAFFERQTQSAITQDRAATFQAVAYERAALTQDIAVYRNWTRTAGLQPHTGKTAADLQTRAQTHLHSLFRAAGNRPTLAIAATSGDGTLTLRATAKVTCKIRQCQSVLHAIETAPQGYRLTSVNLTSEKDDTLIMTLTITAMAEVSP